MRGWPSTGYQIRLEAMKTSDESAYWIANPLNNLTIQSNWSVLSAIGLPSDIG